MEVYPHPGWTCTDPIGSGSGSGAADGMVDGDSPFGQVGVREYGRGEVVQEEGACPHVWVWSHVETSAV